MSEFKDSKTYANLAYAFGGESGARNKYDFFAKQARKDGFEQIAHLFESTANNEKAHAKIWFKELGWLNSTPENLAAAAAGEHEEWTEMYRVFADEARAEGFDRIARLFDRVAKIERRHEDRYRTLLDNIKEDRVFRRPVAQKWECRNCGFIYEGEKAPEVCPVCDHPKAFFEVEVDNF